MVEKIYVACPASFKTGGTESIHQLVYNLNKFFGIKTYVYYVNYNPKKTENPTADAFSIYVGSDEWVDASGVEDSEKNLLIIPEMETPYLENFKKIRKCIWWLSVDNFFVYNTAPKSKPLFYIKHYLKKVLGKTSLEYEKLMFNEFSADFHLVQSYYAAQFLKELNIKNIYSIPDYIHENYIAETKSINLDLKEDIVAYNPAKGYEFTAKLKAMAPNIRWVPIVKMTNEEVFQLLAKAKVYIDFGNHPGKDRIPREAALAGCCLITGKKGSAGNPYDVAIPAKYKLDETEAPAIIALIREIFSNYKSQSNKFNSYLEILNNEKAVYLKEVGDFLKIL
ncbi:hypothetical protein [Mucilaginibacter jinjuensis]|uniref:Glycosyl transferase family 1 n=1 Tax=Mucilaginibacter jinjuensis TaxID=1176721 RepID=A0ABY7TFD3_9SPHI|nr:hypothetical protein [Mucilaginibacter jinjuensis]WCT14908.1 hypothetical protein PQO05_13275 [Mucilaginibacter jinjuensis]